MLAASAPPLFADLALLVFAGSVIAYISSRIGTVPIVGFLVVGAAIGPNGFELVEDIDLVNQAADIGVILLLFTIGIEFSLDRLRQLAGLIVGGGAIQVLVNAKLVAEGVDVPELDTVVMASPTTSDIRFAQMLGRGCR